MPLTFTQYDLYPSGMYSECPFPLVGDGRKLWFNFPESGHRRKDIYIIIDGELDKTPFRNGSPLQTPIRGLARVMASPHEACAVVIDRSEISLAPIVLNHYRLPVCFPDGFNATVTVSVELSACVCCRDSAELIAECVEGALTDPESCAYRTLKACAQTAADTLIPQAIAQRFQDPLEILNEAVQLRTQLSQEVIHAVQRRLPWLLVTGLETNLRVCNEAELVSMSNRMLEELKARMNTLYQAMISSFGTRPITPELGQIILGYEQSHPNASVADLTAFCQSLRQMNEHFSAAALLQMAQDTGCLPNAMGGERRALLS